MNEQIRSYVPETFLLDEKEEMACRECREELAVADPARDFCLLASRGSLWHTGALLSDAVKISRKELAALKSSFGSWKRYALPAADGVLFCFGELSDTGLLPLMLVRENPSAIKRALRLLERTDVVLSPALAALPEAASVTEDLCCTLAEQLFCSDRIFRAEPDADFRLHCAWVAVFAGCRVSVIELPVENGPLLSSEFHRWTAFLCCLFLNLRGDSAKGPLFRLQNLTDEALCMEMDHHPEREKADFVGTPYGFLRASCFEGFTLGTTDDGIRLEVTLLKRSKKKRSLRAASVPEWLHVALLFRRIDSKAS